VLSSAAVGWYVVLAQPLGAPAAAGAAVAVADGPPLHLLDLAYRAANGCVVFACARSCSASRSPAAGARSGGSGASLALSAAADLLYDLHAADGRPAAQALLDLVWTAAFWCGAVGAVARTRAARPTAGAARAAWAATPAWGGDTAHGAPVRRVALTYGLVVCAALGAVRGGRRRPRPCGRSAGSWSSPG
jgi:hypothetical protein